MTSIAVSSYESQLTDEAVPLLSYNVSVGGMGLVNRSAGWSQEGKFSLESALGSRYRPLVESVLLMFVYVIIFITGVIGNVITCVVIARNSYMQTATNYYLFSLAISDLLTLFFGLPPELYTVWEAYPWRFGAVYCLFKTFITEATAAASVLTITAFTVERFIAICYPLRAHTLSSLPRAVRVIVVVWVCACLSALPYPLFTRTYYARVHPDTNDFIAESLICNIPYDWYRDMKLVIWLSFIVLFLVPLCVISTLYVIIGCTLHRSSLEHRSAGSNDVISMQRKSRRGVINMLVAVVVAFFCCWAPYHAQRLMTLSISYDGWTPSLLELQNVLFYMSGIFFYVSATVNPMLYNVMSKKFRRGFSDTLCRCVSDRISGDKRTVIFDSPTHGGVAEHSVTYMSHVGGGWGGAGTFTVARRGSHRHSLVPPGTRPSPSKASVSCNGAAGGAREPRRVSRGSTNNTLKPEVTKIASRRRSSCQQLPSNQPKSIKVPKLPIPAKREKSKRASGCGSVVERRTLKDLINFRRKRATIVSLSRKNDVVTKRTDVTIRVDSSGSVHSMDSANSSHSVTSMASHIREELELREVLPPSYHAISQSP